MTTLIIITCFAPVLFGTCGLLRLALAQGVRSYTAAEARP